jgi:23S rRNA G2069 N7-methylase RlmK/C1962 C5-methylase RlmI
VNYSTGIPKGRAMRGKVARAIDVSAIPGVRSVIADQYDDVVYVQCTPAAWAEIQAQGAKAIGVEHTGEQRRKWLADRDEVWLSELRNEGDEYVVALILSADGTAALEKRTTLLPQAERWQRWLMAIRDKQLARQMVAESAEHVSNLMDLGTKLWDKMSHEEWMRVHPLPRLGE